METAFLIATNRCTRKCPFCFYSTGHLDYPADELDSRDILDAVERIAGLGAREIIVTGGEPLLRPDIMEVLERAGRLGMARLLLTNGELLGPGVAKEIVSLKVEGVTFSVTTMAEARRLEDAMAILRPSALTSLTVTIVFSRANAGEIREIHDWARSRRAGVIIQPAFLPPASPRFDSLSPHRLSAPEWDTVADLLRLWGGERGWGSYPDYVLGLYGRGGKRPGHCLMGTNTFVVDCDGSVVPCFHRRDLPCGNILTSPPGALTARLRESARELLPAPCYGEHCVSLFCGE